MQGVSNRVDRFSFHEVGTWKLKKGFGIEFGSQALVLAVMCVAITGLADNEKGCIGWHNLARLNQHQFHTPFVFVEISLSLSVHIQGLSE